MDRINLTPVKHNVQIADKCPAVDPNVIEDSVFWDGTTPMGFYIKKMPQKLSELVNLANFEFLSDRVPKSGMNRTSGENGTSAKLQQFSTIIGAVPPRPHMKRPYPSISSVHGVKSARNFIKAMLLVANECERVIAEIQPEILEIQRNAVKDVDERFKFGNLFTSSISNYNISAPFHQDNGNIRNTYNVIITKRYNSTGGSLFVPDYNACIEQADLSMLVYPAWRNVHGVTPIKTIGENGYRNSLVFYALKAFLKK